MKTSNLLVLAILSSSLLAACNGSSDERRKATGEKLTGVVQRTVGNITNDENLKRDSKTNELKGDLRSSKEDVKDMVTGN